jgi:hypothetical protein
LVGQVDAQHDPPLRWAARRGFTDPRFALLRDESTSKQAARLKVVVGFCHLPARACEFLRRMCADLVFANQDKVPPTMAWNGRHLLGAASVALLSCSSQPTLKDRLVNAENRATDAERLLDQAEQEMAALEPNRAERTLKQAQKSLSDPDVGYYPEHELISQRLVTYIKRLPQVRKEREAWELAVAVGKRQTEVDRALAELRPAVAALKKRELIRADVDRAKEIAGAVQTALDGGKALENRDIVYSAYALRQRQFLKQSHSEIELAKARLEFIAGPGKARQEALDVSRLAKSEKNRDKQTKLQTEARKKFAECARDGQKMLFEFPPLRGAVTMLGQVALAPQQVVKGCAERAKAPNPVPVKSVRTAKRKT